MKPWVGLAVVLALLAAGCFVVMALSYDRVPAVEAPYINRASPSDSSGYYLYLDEGADHRPWMGAGIALLFSAAAVAATALLVRSRQERARR